MLPWIDVFIIRMPSLSRLECILNKFHAYDRLVTDLRIYKIMMYIKENNIYLNVVFLTTQNSRDSTINIQEPMFSNKMMKYLKIHDAIKAVPVVPAKKINKLKLD